MFVNLIFVQKGKPYKYEISDNIGLIIIDNFFFENCMKMKLPFIDIWSKDSSTHIVIDPLQRTFMRFSNESTDPNYKWQTVYNSDSSSCEKVILVNKQDPLSIKETIEPKAFFPLNDYEIKVVDEDLEIFPLGSNSINIEES